MRKLLLALRPGAFLLAAAPALLAQTHNLVVLSAAGGGSILSPGSLATAYVTGLDAAISSGELDRFGNYPTTLGGFSLNINGTLAQMLYIGGSQINFFMPGDANPGDTPVTLSSNQFSASGTASVRPVAPAIFTQVQNGREIGAILNAVTFQANPFSPETSIIPGCDKRTRIAIYATGIGLAANRVRPRDIRVEATDVSGTLYNLDVEAAVPAPGFTALEQINVVLHTALRPGIIQLRLIANGVPSNRVQFDLAPREAGAAAPSGPCLSRIDIIHAMDGTFSGMLTLAFAAPAGGAAVTMASGDTTVSCPSNITVPAGQYTAPIPINFSAATPKRFFINGALNDSIASGLYEQGPACVDGVNFSFPGIVSGNSFSGRVTLTDPAPSEGTTVLLTSTHPNVTVTPRVTVTPGQMSATFPISTGLATIAAPATVIATASCGGSSAAFNLVLTPCIASVTLPGASISGGGAMTGTVTLNAPALTGGQLVDLRSSDSSVQVDAQVRVPEGQISATFPVKTIAVLSTRQVTILGSVGNCGSASAALTVTQ